MSTPYQPPTAAALRAMPLRDRTAAFLAFVRSRPVKASYPPGDIFACALSRFAQAVSGSRTAHAGCDDLYVGDDRERIKVIDMPDDQLNRLRGWTAHASISGQSTPDKTFGELATFLEAQLAATPAA